MCCVASQPRAPLLRADGQKHNRRLREGNLNALRGMPAPDVLHAVTIDAQRGIGNAGRHTGRHTARTPCGRANLRVSRNIWVRTEPHPRAHGELADVRCVWFISPREHACRD